MQKQSAEHSTTRKQSSSHSKSFKEGLGTLVDEIQLAFQWQRPSILLAIHSSKLGQAKAQLALEKELIKIHKGVKWVKASSIIPDVISTMCKAAKQDEIVFFVSGIGNNKTGVNANIYRALNLHRELLVEQRIRVVFWLTEFEAANLPHHAPDFWAFRHRVVEFAPSHGIGKNAIPVGLLLWKDQVPLMGQKKLKNAIIRLEKILARLPQEEKDLTARLDTLLTLAHYCWLLGDSQKFLTYLAHASNLSEKYSQQHFQAWVLNVKGITSYELGEKNEASLLFKRSLTFEPNKSIFMINLSIALHAIGKNRDAIHALKQGIKQNNNDPKFWHMLGYLYLSTGKLKDGIEAFTKAKDIDQSNILYHYSLAICYYKDGQADSCEEEIKKIREISPKHDPLQRAYIALIDGKIIEAQEQLKQSLEKGEITKQLITRDPNLQILMSPYERIIFQ
jgi:tetratricopeptide (TPR) repeat protein